MKVLLLTDLVVYGLLLISSYFLVFRRSPGREPARTIAREVPSEPIGEVAHPPLAVKPSSERGETGPGHLIDPPEPLTLRPWWASGVAVETSP